MAYLMRSGSKSTRAKNHPRVTSFSSNSRSGVVVSGSFGFEKFRGMGVDSFFSGFPLSFTLVPSVMSFKTTTDSEEIRKLPRRAAPNEAPV